MGRAGLGVGSKGGRGPKERWRERRLTGRKRCGSLFGCGAWRRGRRGRGCLLGGMGERWSFFAVVVVVMEMVGRVN